MSLPLENHQSWKRMISQSEPSTCRFGQTKMVPASTRAARLASNPVIEDKSHNHLYDL